jgi:hypothetical protein
MRPRLRHSVRLARYAVRLVPYVSVRATGRRRLRVYCVANAGRFAFLTGAGQVIRLDEGVTGAARAVAAACSRPGPGRTAAGQAAAVQPGCK